MTATKTRKTSSKKSSKSAIDPIDLLKTGIANLTTSQSWLEYLQVQSKFHRYSFNNTCLILSQCPNATRVAGFGAWLKLERNVKKGETGIRILAPMAVKDEEDPEKTNVFFRTVCVFDISQTEGKEIPSAVTKLTGDDQGIYQKLKNFAANKGIAVNEVENHRINGSCTLIEPITITINSGLEPLQKAKTLAHELAHALMHSGEKYDQHNELSSIELEAESTAFIVLNRFGINTGDYSFGYIASWIGNDPIELAEQLKKSGSLIQKAAKEIIDFLEPSDFLQE